MRRLHILESTLSSFCFTNEECRCVPVHLSARSLQRRDCLHATEAIVYALYLSEKLQRCAGTIQQNFWRITCIASSLLKLNDALGFTAPNDRGWTSLSPPLPSYNAGAR